MTLAAAQAIVAETLTLARAAASKPVAVAVVDAGGGAVATAREDGCGTARLELSLAKARSALALGMPTRTLASFFEGQPALFAALRGAVDGPLLPIPGGVIARDAAGAAVGAAGISGGSLADEEDFVIAAIGAAGYYPDPST